MKKTIIALTALLAATSMLLCSCRAYESDGGRFIHAVPLASVIMEHNTFNTVGATVVSGEAEKYYENVADAWEAANDSVNTDVTFTLWQDWTANEGNFGKTNTAGFDSNGGLVVERRGTVDNKEDTARNIVIDFNGYTVDAARTTAVDGGAVIKILTSSKADKYTAAVTIKNGTITGGKNTYNGGGINMSGYNAVITLQNLIITKNVARNGGGIYDCTLKSDIHITDVHVKSNVATGVGGGFSSYVYPTADLCTRYYLSGEVVVDQNEGVEGTNNFCYDYECHIDDRRGEYGNARFTSFSSMTDSSVIGVSLIPETGFGTVYFSTFTLSDKKNTDDLRFENKFFRADNCCLSVSAVESQKDGGCVPEIYIGYIYISGTEVYGLLDPLSN